uniref:Uncharacterized protein n=1 Tax=Arundo donax TaxID=35708 RepID=A0A0A9CXS1_ARUDO
MVLTLEDEKPKGSLGHEGGCGTRQWPRNIELPAEPSESGASDGVSAVSSYQPGITHVVLAHVARTIILAALI